jgi:hypothetical protein
MLSGEGQGKLKLSGNGNECKPLELGDDVRGAVGLLVAARGAGETRHRGGGRSREVSSVEEPPDDGRSEAAEPEASGPERTAAVHAERHAARECGRVF